MSNSETNKTIARQFLELVSEHNVEKLCDMVAPTWRMHGGPPNLPSGADGIRELFATFGTITQEWTIEDMIAESDKIVVRATNICVQESFWGVPAHGRQQKFTATFIHHIADEKLLKPGATEMTWDDCCN